MIAFTDGSRLIVRPRGSRPMSSMSASAVVVQMMSGSGTAALRSFEPQERSRLDADGVQSSVTGRGGACVGCFGGGRS